MGTEKNVRAVADRLVFLNVNGAAERSQSMEERSDDLVDRMWLRCAGRAHDDEPHLPPPGVSRRQPVDHGFAPGSLGRNGRSACPSCLAIFSAGSSPIGMAR